MDKLLKCETGNYQCGGKCQNRDNKCPSESAASSRKAMLLGKFTNLIGSGFVSNKKSIYSLEDLSDLAELAAQKISSEAKKKARAEKPLGETKKKLLDEENRAWVYLRTFRSYSKIKDKESEEAKTKLVLLQKMADGDGAAHTQAKNQLLEGKKQVISSPDSIGLVEAMAEVVTIAKSKKQFGYKTLLQDLKRLADGEKLDLDSIDTEIFKEAGLYEKNKDKIDRIIAENPEISEKEALGISFWISEDYEIMNKTIYSKASPEDATDLEKEIGLKGSLLAASGLSKLKPFTVEELNKTAEDKGERKAKAYGDELESLDLMRFMRIENRALNRFLKPYEEALVQDGIHQEQTFFATSAEELLQDDELEGTNVIIHVKPKKNGAGKSVDNFKTETYEAEILYAPYTAKFKVVKVARAKKYPEGTSYMDTLNKELKTVKVPELDDDSLSVMDSFSRSTRNMPYPYSPSLWDIRLLSSYIRSIKEIFDDVSITSSNANPYALKHIEALGYRSIDSLREDTGKMNLLKNIEAKYKKYLDEIENKTKEFTKSPASGITRIYMEEI